MTLDESKNVVEAVSQSLSEDAKVIWGAQVSEDMDKTLRTMLIVTGVRSPQIMGKSLDTEQIKKKEIESELGIEFVE